MVSRRIKRTIISFALKQRSREVRAEESTVRINELLAAFHKLNSEIPTLNARFAEAKTPVETGLAVRELASNYAKSAEILRECEALFARINAIAGTAQ